MPPRRIVRLVVLVALAVLVGFAVADVLGLRESDTGVVSPLGYVGVSHGSHTHYVPNGWDGEASISDFPTTPPPEGFTVSQTGEVVPVE